MEKYVRNLMNVFEKSFINRLNELILIPKTNLYICLDDVHNETELKYKIIEFCSRDASKAMPYKTERRNKKYQSKVREKINIYLNANFTADDMYLIYTKLGNRVNHELTIIFVNNNYDLNILKGYKKISESGV